MLDEHAERFEALRETNARLLAKARHVLSRDARPHRT